jgi:hypothetical protein
MAILSTLCVEPWEILLDRRRRLSGGSAAARGSRRDIHSRGSRGPAALDLVAPELTTGGYLKRVIEASAMRAGAAQRR